MKTNKIFFLVAICFLMGCAGTEVSPEYGTLDAQITIGPLCPVIKANDKNPCGLTDSQLDAIYSQYSLNIESISNTSFQRVAKTLDRTGIVKNELPVGEYKIYVNAPSGSIRSGNITQNVVISKNQVTQIAINVDTGIR